VDPGIPFKVGTFCILISNFNIYNTKKGQKPKYIVHINNIIELKSQITNKYNSQITNDKSYTSRQKLHQSPLYYTVTTNKKYSQTHDIALTSPIHQKEKKKEKKKVTDHLSPRTTSHGSLGPLTNTKTPHSTQQSLTT
jgi:hypothetical protein